MNGRRLAGAVVAGVLVSAIAGLSRVPYRQDSAGLARLRLSWRAISERVDACRRATPEEMARLPAHMRQDSICEGRVAPFRLRVEIDGETVIDEEIRAAGAREDRPVYVLREWVLVPGAHALRVRFTREDPPDGRMAATGPTGARFPASLEWEGELNLDAGAVALITYEASTRSLAARLPEPREAGARAGGR